MKITIPSLRLNVEQLIQWLAVGGVYAPIYFLEIPIKLVFESIFIVIALMLIYSQKKTLPVSKSLIWGILAIFTVGIIVETLNGYGYGKTIQQIILLSFFYFGYYIIFRFNRGKVKEIFEKYLKLSYIMAILAIAQEVIYLGTGISIFRIFTYDRDILAGSFVQVNAFCGEPSNFATLITAAFVYNLLTIKTNLKHLIVIGLAIVFTFSTTTYLIAFLAIGYKLVFRSGFFFRVATLTVIGIGVVYGTVLLNSEMEQQGALSDISTKIEDTVDGLAELQPEAIELLNMSSYATLMNLYIAVKAPSRVVGTGIGTHPDSYEKLYQSDIEYYGLNKNDAYAILTRVYSELGFIGLILLIGFVIKNFRYKSVVNTAVLFFILSTLVRGGHYTISGTVLFIFLYYYSAKEQNENNYRLLTDSN